MIGLQYNLRKQYLQNKHIKSMQEYFFTNLKKYNKDLKNNFLGNDTKSQTCLLKIEILIYLKKICEAEKCINQLLTESLLDDKNIIKAYFFKGFIKFLLKDYKNALRLYDKSLKHLCIADKKHCNTVEESIYMEIENINKTFYGNIEGCIKNVKYFTNILNAYPYNLTALKYRARSNYFVNIKQAIKDYTLLIKTADFNDSKIYFLFARIKCNIRVWKQKNINRFNEIIKDLTDIEKKIKEETPAKINLRYYTQEKILTNYFKSIIYKLTNDNFKSAQYKNKTKKLLKENLFINRFKNSNKKCLGNFISKTKFTKKVYKYAFFNLFYNTNITFRDFKFLYTKLNIKILLKEINSFLPFPADFTQQKQFEERFKYIINKNNINLNYYKTPNGEKFLSYACYFGASLSFLKYLSETKKVNYKNDKNILSCAADSSANLTTIKYLIEKLKLPKQNNVLFSVCKYCDIKVLQYLLEKQNYNPHIKNDNGETLLFEIARLKDIKQKHIDILKYLIYTCNVNTKIKNKNNRTFLDTAKETGHFNNFTVLKCLENWRII